jgi:hypothetical protein
VAKCEKDVNDCTDALNQVYEVNTEIVSLMSDPVSYTVKDGYVWKLNTMGSSAGMVTQEQGNEYCTCTAIPVKAGERYLITIYSNSYGEQYATSAKVILASKESEGYYDQQEYTDPNFSTNQWLITIPNVSGSLYLLLTSSGRPDGGISAVRKMRI